MKTQEPLENLLHNPKTYQEIMDDMGPRKSEAEVMMTGHLQEIVSQHVGNIIESGARIEYELETYGIRNQLYDYFIQHPSAWYELKRKLHAYKKINDDGRYIIPKDKEEYLLSVFLRRGGEIIDHNIESLWRDILKNQHLLSRIATEPSLMDSSHGQLKGLEIQSKNQRRKFIEKALKISYISNVDLNSESDIETRITELLPICSRYLFEIFNITISIPKSKHSFKSIVDWLTDQLWPDKGVQSKHAWMLIKSIRAWGSFDYILEQHKKANEYIYKIPNILREHGFDFSLGKMRSEDSYDGKIDIHEGYIDVGCPKKVKVEYRTKSIRSSLLKLWESEDYNNYDALRDTIGLVVIFPEDIDEEIRLNIIGRMSAVMDNKGYMLKNKGLIDNKKDIKKIVSEQNQPLGTIVEGRKGKSSEKLKNLSFSGFTHIDSSPVGIEIQFYNVEGYAFWKKDHTTFDVLKVVSAWARGGWFITPRQMLDVVRKNIPRNILEAKLKKRPQEVIYDYIQSGSLLPYMGKQGAIYLVPKQYENLFFGKFAYTMPLHKNEHALKEFISNLSSPTTL